MKPIATTLVLLALTQAGWAEAARRALILESRGAASIKSGSFSDKAMTGQVLRDGDTVELSSGSLTLLLLGKGERLQVTGPAQVTVKPTGFSVSGGTTNKLSTVQPKLALTGDNHRQIGGQALRGNGDVSKLTSHFDQVVVTLDAKPTITVSAPATAVPAASLVFQFEDGYLGHNLTPNLNQVVRGSEGLAFASVVAQPVVSGGRVSFSAQCTAEPGSLVGVRVLNSGGEELLYTKVYCARSGDAEQLRNIRLETEAWAAREPENPGPWLVYAEALEEKGQLGQAREAVDRALALRPGDEGLRQLKARLQMDLGDYSGAAATLQPSR